MINKSSAVAEMGDRFATIDMDRKVGGGCCAPFCASPFAHIDINRAMVIVWRVRGKSSRSVLCNIVRNSCAQCTAMHTHMNRLTVLSGFCLTGPISLCLDSFLYVLCVSLYIVCTCVIVTW